MSKKKNTLKDLDEFLRQQAATLVTPTPLSNKIIEEPEQDEKVVALQGDPDERTMDRILKDLETLSRKEGISLRKKIYDLIMKSAATNGQSLPEDKMLINTVLYLKNGDRWKEAIREYWRNNG